MVDEKPYNNKIAFGGFLRPKVFEVNASEVPAELSMPPKLVIYSFVFLCSGFS